jgi:hypothetical protein
MGATLENGMVADFITAGVLNAALVKVINIDADNINAGLLSSERIDGSTINIKDGATLGNWNISNGALFSGEIDENGDIRDGVWLEPGRIFWIEYSGASAGMYTTWDHIVQDMNVLGLTETVNIGGKICVFQSGRLVSVEE